MTVRDSRLVRVLDEDDRSPEALAFIEEVTELCLRHGFAIGHEETNKAFQIYRLRGPEITPNLDWFKQAQEIHYLDELRKEGLA